MAPVSTKSRQCSAERRSVNLVKTAVGARVAVDAILRAPVRRHATHAKPRHCCLRKGAGEAQAAGFELHRVWCARKRLGGRTEGEKSLSYAGRMDFQSQLQELSDDALLVNLKRFVGASNQLTALVLAHLGEVDARGAYRHWACASLQSYCVYELRFSEDEAQRRCRAARVARQFPILFDMIADGSIHLTGILLLAPCLTRENHVALLAAARYRSKREIELLIAAVAPREEVPALVEPIGLDSARPRRRGEGTWSEWVERAWPGRDLVPGDGPTQAPCAPAEWVAASPAPAGIREDEWRESTARGIEPTSPHAAAAAGAPETAACASPGHRASCAPEEPIAAPERYSSMRYKVQFTADQAYVDLLDQVRDLLQHQIPNRDLAKIQQLAMEALLEKLGRRKYGAHPRSRKTPNIAPPPDPSSQATDLPLADAQPPASEAKSPTEVTTQRRFLPAPLRRAVWLRDAGRCTFVDARGVRCRETAKLEFHHERAYALGGPANLDNITLRCRAHNDLAAEQDFGSDFMQRQKRRDKVGIPDRTRYSASQPSQRSNAPATPRSECESRAQPGFEVDLKNLGLSRREVAQTSSTEDANAWVAGPASPEDVVRELPFFANYAVAPGPSAAESADTGGTNAHHS
jgi:hypothetical protein